MSEFAKNFKALREARHLSQTQLADRLKMSKSAISMYENGRREPKFEDLITIANFFNVDASYLIGSRSQVEQLTGTPEDDAASISLLVTAEELAVVKAYRVCGAETKENVRRILRVEY